MRKQTIARISVVGGAAALCLGVASPALASTQSTGGMHHPALTSEPDPLAAAIASADEKIARRLDRLAALTMKVTNDTNLTTGQKVEMLATIDAARSAVQAQKAQLDLATSLAEVTTDLRSPVVMSAETAVSLVKAIVRADDTIAAIEAKLTKWTTQLAADPNLSAMQKSDLAAKISAERAKLIALQASIDSATSTAQVSSLLHGAKLSSRPWNCDDPGKQPKQHPSHPSTGSSGRSAKVVVAAVTKPMGHPAGRSHDGSASRGNRHHGGSRGAHGGHR